MTLLLTNIKATIKQNPHQVFVGLGVFFTVIMGTSVQHVASGVFGLFFLTSLFVIGKWASIWRSLNKSEKWWLFGLICYAASGVVAYINVQDVSEYIKVLERYLRFLLVVPIYLYIRYYKINVIRYLYVGATVSGPLLLCVALNSYFEHPELPAKGHYHHIIFGSVMMLNVGVMLSALLTIRLEIIYKVLLSISIMCGVGVVVLSQSRGVWLLLPVYFLIIIFYTIKYLRPRLLIAMTAGLLIVGGLLSQLQGEMIQHRVSLAAQEVSSYYDDGQYKSSLGTRLAMWDVAIDVWGEHPVIGTGPGDFDEVIINLQKDGEFTGMQVFSSTHNIYMQAIVNAGTIGLIAMIFGLFYWPYKVVSRYKINAPSKYILNVFYLLSFATIGIGESWTLRLPIISVYIAYSLAIYSSLVFSENNDELLGKG